jgi:nickel-dependent lactate racemase
MDDRNTCRRGDQSMADLFIRTKDREKLTFELPVGWKLLTLADFEDHRQIENTTELVQKALENPIQSAPLNEKLSPSDTIAIIVEDITRASPKKPIMRALTAHLEACGIKRQNITVVIALGTHRALSKDEMTRTYGEDIVARYTFINHDCYANDQVPVGKLKTGCTVKINRHVVEAGFRIGVGSIFPHNMNGYGGGGKILFPGVADFESIREHHLKYRFHASLGLGKTDGNVFYEEVSALAQSGRLNFILNSVLDHRDDLYDIVAGHPLEAHRSGIQTCESIISKQFAKKADVTIVSAFPYTEGPQILKPLAPAGMVTREGGCIILAADGKGNLPDQFVSDLGQYRQSDKKRLQAEIRKKFESSRLILPNCPIELNMAGATALKAQSKFKVIIASENYPAEKIDQMGFIHAGNLEEALDTAKGLMPAAEVHVLPSGGVILPIVATR